MGVDVTAGDDPGGERLATRWLAGRWLRARWMAVLPIALIVAVGTTGSLVALGAAQRTDRAYGDYLERSNIGDLLLNPSLQTEAADAAIRALPGVEAIARDAFLFAVVDGDGWQESAAAGLNLTGSTEGRYVDLDRPLVREGRLPTGPSEALVNADLATTRSVEVGDELTITFYSAYASAGGYEDSLGEPVGAEQVTVVGVAVFPGEVLPDALYPRPRMLVSPDVAERYDCLLPMPPADADLEEAAGVMFPDACSTAYSFYSMSFGGDERRAPAAQDAFVQRATELNAALPPAVVEEGLAHRPIVTTTAQEQERVERSTRPTVAALAALGLFVAAITVVLTMIAVVRELRRVDRAQNRWWQLGVTTRDRAIVAGAPLVVALVAGLAVAAVATWALSPVGPVGTVRVVDPSPTRAISGWSWIGLAALAVALLAGAVVAAWSWAARLSPGRARARRSAPVLYRLRGSNRPEVAEGARAALSWSGGSGLVVSGGAVAVAVFVAAAVFGASLTSLVSTPAKYGWPWDAGAMGGLGYGYLDIDGIEAAFDAHDGVARWTGLGFNTAISLEGEPTVAIVADDQRSAADAITVAAGRLPVHPDEIALGSQTAARRGIAVGDEVALTSTEFEPRQATVTGLVVLPALGSIGADRAAPGAGLLLPGSALTPLQLERWVTFFGIVAADGVDPASLLADLGDSLVGADSFVTFTYPEPVRPAEIVDAASMRDVPLLVAAVMVITAVCGLAAALLVSVRSRRRDLATLRALGFTSRQIRRSVRVQALCGALAGLVIGVPLGLLAGRVLWRAFAEQLGVVPEPSSPPLLVAASTAGALILALAAAQLPARVASRSLPAEGLRAE